MALLWAHARLQTTILTSMTLDELQTLAVALPLNAPDERANMDRLLAALTSYNGMLLNGVSRLSQAPGDSLLIREAAVACGASLLVFAAIASRLNINLNTAVSAGVKELGGG
jgi:hypothetical protein